MPKVQSTAHVATSTIDTAAGPPANLIIADSGATAHFATLDLPVLNRRPATNPIAIANPDGTLMYSTHEGELNIPGLPIEARRCHIVPALSGLSLISIGQLCSAGCQVLFDNNLVTVYLNGKTIITGPRSPVTKNLWHLNLQQPTQLANTAIGTTTPTELVAFAHASLFSPALSTLTKALKLGYIANCPGLSEHLLRKHPPQSFAMVKGHLDQTRKNQHTTKITVDTAGDDDDTATFPITTNDEKTHACYAAIMEPTGQIYTDKNRPIHCPIDNWQPISLHLVRS